MFSYQSGTAMFLCMAYGRGLSADLDPRNVKSYRIDWDRQCGQKVGYKYCSRMGILPRTYQSVWVLMGFDGNIVGILWNIITREKRVKVINPFTGFSLSPHKSANRRGYFRRNHGECYLFSFLRWGKYWRCLFLCDLSYPRKHLWVPHHPWAEMVDRSKTSWQWWPRT